jgi:hypothetical protein
MVYASFDYHLAATGEKASVKRPLDVFRGITLNRGYAPCLLSAK